MRDWILPALGALLFWGFWSFIPKITTKFIDPKSAIVYEAIGSIVLAIIILSSLNFQPAVHPKGIVLAIITGTLGFLGAFCFLNAVARGPVALVATLSALYPAISIVLANVFLHETLTLKQGMGIALALLSVILVTA